MHSDPTPTPPASGRDDVFLTTRWSVVVAASRRSTPDSGQALAHLCQTYWYPLYAYVRRRVRSREDAEDLTQAFFTLFLETNPLAGVSADRGRFRAFLLASLRHFLSNERDRAGRQNPAPVTGLVGGRQPFRIRGSGPRRPRA